MKRRFEELRNEVENLRWEAVTAQTAGEKPAADCLTGKVIGMRRTIDIAERIAHDRHAVGELEGMERVIEVLGPLPRC